MGCGSVSPRSGRRWQGWASALKKTLHASEQARPDIAQARQAWQAELPELEVEHLVFLVETWASTNMTPTRGRSPIGTRRLGRAPYGHWKTTTVVSALRCDGLVALWVIDGPINGQTLRTWVEEVLVPVLHPGDIVVLDNLGSHKVAGIEAAMATAGAQLRYLPPCSQTSIPLSRCSPR
jgi:hypothetical protein